MYYTFAHAITPPAPICVPPPPPPVSRRKVLSAHLHASQIQEGHSGWGKGKVLSQKREMKTKRSRPVSINWSIRNEVWADRQTDSWGRPTVKMSRGPVILWLLRELWWLYLSKCLTCHAGGGLCTLRWGSLAGRLQGAEAYLIPSPTPHPGFLVWVVSPPAVVQSFILRPLWGSQGGVICVHIRNGNLRRNTEIRGQMKWGKEMSSADVISAVRWRAICSGKGSSCNSPFSLYCQF